MLSSAKYFLYRENPFRILYLDALGFCEPPRTNEQNLNYKVWWFTQERIAREMLRALSRSEETFLGEKADLSSRGLFVSIDKPLLRPDVIRERIVPKKKNSLENLA